MSIEIPSLPSADINNMMSLFLMNTKQTFKTWPAAPPEHSESMSEGDRTPEPRTPKFGVSPTPTFEESNNLFGFKFPQKPSSLGKTIQLHQNQPSTVDTTPKPTSLAPDYIVVTDDEEDAPNIPTFVLEEAEKIKVKKPKVEASDLPQIMLASGDGKPASYIRFLNDPIPFPVAGEYLPREVNLDFYRKHVGSDGVMADIDAIQQMESVEHSVTQPVVCSPSTYQIPSPVSHVYPVNKPESRSPSPYHTVLAPEVHEHPDKSSASSYHTEDVPDVAAYQSIEDTPMDTEIVSETPTYITLTTRQPGHTKSVEEPSLQSHWVVPDIPTASDVNTVNHVEVLEEPSLTQSEEQSFLPTTVDQLQMLELQATHIEVVEEMPQSQFQEQPVIKNQLQMVDTQGHHVEAVEGILQTQPQRTGNQQQIVDPQVQAESSSVVKPPLQILNSLKNKIQLKRKMEGKGELKVTFEDRPLGEPSEEEKQKAETRRQKNRESAVKSRKRRQDLTMVLENEVKALERENKKLKTEIRKMEGDVKKMSAKPLECGCDLIIDNTSDIVDVSGRCTTVDQRGVSGDQMSDDQMSLREAIQNLLAKEKVSP